MKIQTMKFKKTPIFSTLVEIPPTIVEKLEALQWQQAGQRAYTKIHKIAVNLYRAEEITNKAIFSFFQIEVDRKIFYRLTINPPTEHAVSLFPDWNSMVKTIGNIIGACEAGVQEWMEKEEVKSEE